MKKIFSVFLVICLCVGIAVPALAANPEDIGFTATLDNDKLTVSEVDQTVTLTVGTASDLTFDSAEYFLSAEDDAGNDAEFTYSAISSTIGSGESAVAFGPAKTGAKEGRFFVSFYTPDAENITGSFLGSFTVTIPANTQAGTYTINVTGIATTKDYGEPYETGASASATLTIEEPASEGGYNVTMSAASEVASGESVNVNLDVTHTKNTTFNAFSATLSYNADVFTYDAANSTLGQFTVSEADAAAPGTLNISRSGSEVTIPGTGAELTLAFTAKTTGAATSGVFALSDVKVSAADTVRTNDADNAAVTNPSLTVSVTVAETVVLEGISVTTKPNKTTYNVGDTFDPTGMVVTASYSDASEKPVTGYTFSPEIMAADTTAVTISYTENGVTESTSVPVKVTVVTVEGASDSYLSGYTLIQVKATNLPEGNVPTYDGNAMFQIKNAAGQSIYDETAYYYIVETGTYNAALVSHDAGSAVLIDHTAALNADTNNTGVIDINDAQFVYNIYSGYYSDLTAVELLRADVNGNGAVDVSDCAAVVAKIF